MPQSQRRRVLPSPSATNCKLPSTWQRYLAQEGGETANLAARLVMERLEPAAADKITTAVARPALLDAS
jgi:hypothetical protein